ncbi:MAG: MBL fold metallo-hydrolase, partial [Candidatus Harrisonbacteria bacterium]|nr:MBL fold metallo-hydrolase [Candidatus Harrisonbacteria bacterium]
MTFYGGVKVVTGANYLVESGDTRILIDCGMHQGSNFCEKHNFEPFPYEPKSINAVF